MSKERLAGLTMMAVHYAEAMERNTEDVVKRFIEAHPRRLFCNSVLFEDEGDK